MNDQIDEQHNSISKGLVAGFIATLVLSMMMVIKSMIGLMPQLDVIAMLSGMLGVSAVVAWIVHFVIGTVGYGFAISLLSRAQAKSAAVLGLMLGIMAPIMTLMLHLIFGAVLGWVYDKMTGRLHAHQHAS